MEVQILYTIELVIHYKSLLPFIKKDCENNNILMEITPFIGIYKFTGSYEWNIRKIQIKYKLNVFDATKNKKRTYANKKLK